MIEFVFGTDPIGFEIILNQGKLLATDLAIFWQLSLQGAIKTDGDREDKARSPGPKRHQSCCNGD